MQQDNDPKYTSELTSDWTKQTKFRLQETGSTKMWPNIEPELSLKLA